MRPPWHLLRSDAVGLVTVGVLSQTLTVVSGPLVARMVGPAGRGEIATVLAVALVCNQLSLTSLGRGISRVVAHEHRPARDVVGGFVGTWIAWAGLSALVAGVITAWALRRVEDPVLLAAGAFAITFVGGVVSLYRSMAFGEDHVTKVNLADLTFSASYVVLVAALFLGGHDQTALVILGCYVLAQAAYLVMIRRAVGVGTGAASDPATRTEVHRFARSAFFGSVGSLDRLGLDVLLVGQLLGTTLLGLYSVASSIAALPAIAIGFLVTPLLPKMVAREPAAAAVLLRRWLLLAVAMSVPAIIVLWFALPLVLQFFFGPAFLPAVWPARFLLIANVAFALRLLLTAAAQAQGRERSASLITLGGAVALLASLAIGAGLGDLEGAAAGTAVGATLSLLSISSIVRWSAPRQALSATDRSDAL